MAESPLEHLVGAWEFEPFVEGSRGAFAVAERLGTEPVIFPSNHGGSLGGEYGQTGDPDAFAAKLRDVLAER
jgi:hypothetical protein